VSSISTCGGSHGSRRGAPPRARVASKRRGTRRIASECGPLIVEERDRVPVDWQPSAENNGSHCASAESARCRRQAPICRVAHRSEARIADETRLPESALHRPPAFSHPSFARTAASCASTLRIIAERHDDGRHRDLDHEQCGRHGTHAASTEADRHRPLRTASESARRGSRSAEKGPAAWMAVRSRTSRR